MKMKIEGNLADLLASDADTIAIVDPHDSSKTLSHRIVSDFVHDFDLGLSPLATKKQRVVVALPCGPTLALACLAVATYYTMAPMTPNCGAEQFRTDVKRVQATAIIVTAEDRERLQLRDSSWIVELGIKVYTIEYKDNGTFRFQLMGDGDDMQIDSQQRTTASPMPNQGDDIAIVLFTSGTSGTKKLVPIPTHTLISGVMFVIKSWNLGYTDRCLNMMPLHHM
jgi:long-subunit acyl-CoA synthetase (AMP-forming)